MANYCFAFNKGIEAMLKNYVAKNPKKEVFVAMFGIVHGKKCGIEFRIDRVVAFPNTADDPANYGEIPENWMDVCGEVCKLEQMRFLGFFHSHPTSKGIRSSQDTKFALETAEKEGNILMGIVSNRSVLRMYFVEENRINLIPGTVNLFKIAMKD